MSTQGSSGGDFRFETEADVSHVLASVRQADISAEQKNELRDTIFLYTNGGRDQTVRLALEQQLAAAGVAPVARAADGTQSGVTGSPFGFSRSGPSTFAVSQRPAVPA